MGHEYIIQVDGYTYFQRAASMQDALAKWAASGAHPNATQIVVTKRA